MAPPSIKCLWWISLHWMALLLPWLSWYTIAQSIWRREEKGFAIHCQTFWREGSGVRSPAALHWCVLLWWGIQCTEGWGNIDGKVSLFFLLPWWWTCGVTVLLINCQNKASEGTPCRFIVHSCWTFFNPILTLCLCQVLILKTCRIYNVFGSGASHTIYAQFMAQLALANRGWKVCLIQGAGTRMALCFYAMIWLLCLQQPLKATIYQQKCLDLTLTNSVKGAVQDINDKNFWKCMYILLRAVFPALRALWYCDSNMPCIKSHVAEWLSGA